MSAWRLEIAYDGTGFRGWARQPGMRTVQEELESALDQILHEQIRLTVAGRTDAGVHAWGQVASFERPGDAGPLEPRQLKRSLNAVTPREIAVTDLEPAPPGFDARRDAGSRAYSYRIETGSPRSPFELNRSLWWPRPMDLDALAECATLLRGEHDFTAFTPSRAGHVHFRRRILDAGWEWEVAGTRELGAGPAAQAAGGPPILRFRIEADAFLQNMIRALVGTMLEVATGRRTVAGFKALLEGAPREQAGETAPPHGLYLAAVRYN